MSIIIDSDIIVFASVKPDSLPTVLMEAMIGEKAIVASSVGGVTEMVEDGVNGLIVPPSNSGKLASAIIRLLDNRRLLQSMGKNGKQIVATKFNSDTQITKIMNIYHDLV